MSAGGIAVIGSPAETRGFRLAGVDEVRCRDRGDIEAAVRGWSGSRADAPVLVLVSPRAYALAPGVFQALETDLSAPVVLVLPVPDIDQTRVGGVPDIGPTKVGPVTDTRQTRVRPASDITATKAQP